MPRQAARTTPRLKALRKNRKAMAVNAEGLLTSMFPPAQQPSPDPPSSTSKGNPSADSQDGHSGDSMSASSSSLKCTFKPDARPVATGDVEAELQTAHVRDEGVRSFSTDFDVEDPGSKNEGSKRKSLFAGEGISRNRNQNSSSNPSPAGPAQVRCGDAKTEILRNEEQTPCGSPRKAGELCDSEHVKTEGVSPEYSFLDIENLFNSPLQSLDKTSEAASAACHPAVLLHPDALQLLSHGCHARENHDDENYSDPLIGQFFYHTNARKAPGIEAVKELNPSSQLPTSAHSSERDASSGVGVEDFPIAESPVKVMPGSAPSYCESAGTLHLGVTTASQLERPSGFSSTSGATSLQVLEEEPGQICEEIASLSESVQVAKVHKIEPGKANGNCFTDVEVAANQLQLSELSSASNVGEVSLAKNKKSFPRQKKRPQKSKISSNANSAIDSEAPKETTHSQNDWINFCGFPAGYCPDSRDFHAAANGKKRKRNSNLQDEKKSRKKASTKDKLDTCVSSVKTLTGSDYIDDFDSVSATQSCDPNAQPRQGSPDLDHTHHDGLQSVEGELNSEGAERKESSLISASVRKRSARKKHPRECFDGQDTASDYSLEDGDLKSPAKEQSNYAEFFEAICLAKDPIILTRPKKSSSQTRPEKKPNEVTQERTHDAGNKADNSSQSLKNCADDQGPAPVGSETPVADDLLSKTAGSKSIQVPPNKSSSFASENNLPKLTKEKKPKKAKSSSSKSSAKDEPHNPSEVPTFEEGTANTKRKRNKEPKMSSVKKHKNVRNPDTKVGNSSDADIKHSTEKIVSKDDLNSEKENVASGIRQQNIHNTKAGLPATLRQDSRALAETAAPTPSNSVQTEQGQVSKTLSGKTVKSAASDSITALKMPASLNCDLTKPNDDRNQMPSQPSDPENFAQQLDEDTCLSKYAGGRKVARVVVESAADTATSCLQASSPVNYFSCHSRDFSGAAEPGCPSAASATKSIGTAAITKNKTSVAQPHVPRRAGQDNKKRSEVPELKLSFHSYLSRKKGNKDSSSIEFRSVPTVPCNSATLQDDTVSFTNKTDTCVLSNNLPMASMSTRDHSYTDDASCPLESLSITSSGERKHPKILHAPSLSVVKFTGIFSHANSNTSQGDRVSCSFASSDPTGSSKSSASSSNSERITHVGVDKTALKINTRCESEWKLRDSFASDKPCETSLVSSKESSSRGLSPTFQNETAEVPPFGACETMRSGPKRSDVEPRVNARDDGVRERQQHTLVTSGQASNKDHTLTIEGREYRVLDAKLLLPLYDPLQFLRRVPPQPLILTLKRECSEAGGHRNFDIDDYTIHHMGC